MMESTPTPQAKALKRVLKISRLDGWSLVVIAGLSLLLTLLLVEPLGMTISLLVLAAGIMELRGQRALKRRDPDGMKLLIRSQMFVLAVILVYCARCIGSFDAGYLKDEVLPEARQMLMSWLGISLDEFLKQGGLTVNDLLLMAQKAVWLLYGTVATVSLIYQGGLALFYRSKTRLVTEALAAAPVPPAHPPLA